MAAQIALHHFGDQRLESGLVAPAQHLVRLARIADQQIDLGGAKIAGINRHQQSAGLGVMALFVRALAAPGQRHADLGEGRFGELADRMGLAGGQDIIVALRLLQHQPHAAGVFARMAPVALGVEIAEVQPILKA